MVAAPAIRTRGFNCANCGAAVELRALTHTRAVTCTSCGSLLDPRDPNVVILIEAARRARITPDIPIGTRGTWHDHPFEVIGFQRRSITVDETRYSWDEYVLFNPYQGFRYLTNYQGHWNDVRTLRELPRLAFGQRAQATVAGRTYRHFQQAVATTDYVIGEFPWRVRVGESVQTDDFIAPPFILSSEGRATERTWSLGEYTPASAIWSAFRLPGSPARPVGIFANQPNPYKGRSSGVRWISALCVLLLTAIPIWRVLTAARQEVFSGQYTWDPRAREASFVTPTFTLRKPANLDIRLRAALHNNWLGFDIAVIDANTGTAYNHDKEISYYSGVDGGEYWSEGSGISSLFIPPVPAGDYYLRVEPAGDPQNTSVISYAITVVHDVPSLLPYGIALGVLVLVWSAGAVRSWIFEARREAEGDYGSSDDDDDDDD